MIQDNRALRITGPTPRLDLLAVWLEANDIELTHTARNKGVLLNREFEGVQLAAESGVRGRRAARRDKRRIEEGERAARKSSLEEKKKRGTLKPQTNYPAENSQHPKFYTQEILNTKTQKQETRKTQSTNRLSSKTHTIPNENPKLNNTKPQNPKPRTLKQTTKSQHSREKKSTPPANPQNPKKNQEHQSKSHCPSKNSQETPEWGMKKVPGTRRKGRIFWRPKGAFTSR
ncbi:hypothetical protein KM043_003553 [Ampulex compressa]|nr:hypothetical protein KM043_003553 [Ampulex compressa]